MMCDEVQLRAMTASSFPTGTGSYGYRQCFELIVRNLGPESLVSVVCADGKEHGAHRVGRVADGRERWELQTSFPIYDFAVKLAVGEATYWDDNGGQRYHVPVIADDFGAVLGRCTPIVLGVASLSAGALSVFMGVKNIGYGKEVGVRFTTDGWATSQVAAARYQRTMPTGVEVWEAHASVGEGVDVKLALYCRAGGVVYWDNNFGADYTVAAGAMLAEVW